MQYWIDGTALYHYGILGQKWGKRNGPPYPLDADDHSTSEKKAGWRKSLRKFGRVAKPEQQKSRLIRRAKRQRFTSKAPSSSTSGNSRKATNAKAISKLIALTGGLVITEALVYKLADAGSDFYYNFDLSDIAIDLKSSWDDNKNAESPTLTVSDEISEDFVSTKDDTPVSYSDIMFQHMDSWIKQLQDKGIVSNNGLIKTAEDALKKLWSKAWFDEISDSEYTGVYNYTGSWYKPINEFLRIGKLEKYAEYSIDSTKYLIEQATSALKKAALPAEAIVHRGVGSLSALAKTLGVPVELLTKTATSSPMDLIGMDFVDKAFGSAGATPADAWNGCRLHICLPKDSQAMYVAPISQHSNEHEVLINRGAHYVIKDVEIGTDGSVTDLVIELLNHIN